MDYSSLIIKFGLTVPTVSLVCRLVSLVSRERELLTFVERNGSGVELWTLDYDYLEQIY